MFFRQLAALDARRAGKLLLAGWLIALLCAPAIAFALGKRQPLLENKPHSALAQHRVRDLTDPLTFRELDLNALENNPLREFALDTRARVVTGLFDDSPSADVVLGKDGWLFDRDVLDGCADSALTDWVLSDLDILSRALRAAGKRPAIVVTGSKLVAEDTRSPRVSAAEMRCVRNREKTIGAGVAGIPGGVVLDSALRAQTAAGHDVFLKDDSHWNGLGRVIAARAIFSRLLPERNRPVIGLGDPEKKLGDIARFTGFSRRERFLNNPATMPPGHRPLKPGAVAYLGDSQLQSALFNGPRGPGFVATPGSQLCRWGSTGTARCQSAIRRARYVAIETVSHHFERISGCFEPLVAAVAALKGRPAALAGKRSLRIGPTGQAPGIGVDGAPEISNAPRVVRLSSTPQTQAGLGQQVLRGAPAQCPSSTSIAGQLVVVLPAGARLSDLRIGITAAPGSTFRADVIDLGRGPHGL